MLGRSSELMLTNVAQKNSGMYHCFAEVVGVSYLLWRNNVFDPAFPLTRFVLTMPGTLASAPMLSLVPIISFYLLQFIFRPTINNLVTNKNSLHLARRVEPLFALKLTLSIQAVAGAECLDIC